MVSAKTLLGKLPAFRDDWIVIKKNHKVSDIIEQILTAHERYASYYDKIALYFDGDTTEQICENLYRFIKKNVKYNEEPEEKQTTSLPTGILYRGEGDCKHYASFCGGVLNAINRLTGKKIDWCYRFASYNIFQRTPHHVFVVVFDRGKEIWIDPVPGANQLTPVWQLDKKINVKSMPLYENIGSVGYAMPVEYNEQNYIYEPYQEPTPVLSVDPAIPVELAAEDYYQEVQPDLDDTDLSAPVIDAIQVLLKNGVVNDLGDIDQSKLLFLYGSLPTDQALELSNAMDLLNSQNVGGFFSDIWRGVKKVTIAAPRGAFLAGVALNVFGMATKLKQATKTQDGINKVRNKWYSLGGDWAKLRQAIDNGSKRARIGGIGAAAAAPAWIVTAGAIIAAIMPLVTAILKQQQQQGIDMTDLENQFGGGGNLYNPTPTGAGIMDWIKSNPIPVAAIGFLLVNFVLLPKEKRLIKI